MDSSGGKLETIVLSTGSSTRAKDDLRVAESSSRQTNRQFDVGWPDPNQQIKRPFPMVFP
jgi:hypothetical protein